MNIDTLLALIFTFGTIFNYYLWKERRDKNYLHLSLVGGAGLVLKILNYLIKSLFDLSSKAEVIRSTTSLMLWLIIFCLIIFIMFKIYKRK